MLISIIAHDTLQGISCVTLWHKTFNENPKQIPSFKKPISALNTKAIIKHMVCLGKDWIPQTVGICFLGQHWLAEAELYIFLVILRSTKRTYCQTTKSSHIFQQDTCTLLLQFWSMGQNEASVSLDRYRIYKERHSSYENRVHDTNSTPQIQIKV